jgi:F-type H+-transporting ATPase subunit epsilon
MADQLRLVVVTPEKPLLDEPVSALRFPLYDGQIGILPGRAPLVGRLGYGELVVTTPEGQQRSYYIDGGFVQITGSVVSLLTHRAVPAKDVDIQEAEAILKKTESMPTLTETEYDLKLREQERARRMMDVAKAAR